MILKPVTATQRVLLVALLTPVALVAIVALIPALIVLPFTPNGTDRLEKLFKALTDYIRTLLSNSKG